MKEILRLVDDPQLHEHSTIPSRVIVIDDFYDDPDKVREKILTSYKWTGFTSSSEGRIGFQLEDAEAKASLTSKIGAILEDDIEVSAHYFRLTTEVGASQAHIHRDYTINAIVYLNLPDQFPKDAGTMFLSPKHKEWCLADQSRHKFMPEFWNVDVLLPMKYNRCVIFDGMIPHSRTSTFGKDLNDGRLTEHLWITKVGKTELDKSNGKLIKERHISGNKVNSYLSPEQLNFIKGKLSE